MAEELIKQIDIADVRYEELVHSISDYAAFLISKDFSITTDDYFLVSGEIPAQTTWILHLSIVLPQIPELLDKLIPLFEETGVPFSMPKDLISATMVHYGHLGYMEFAKIITLYPSNEEDIISLVNALKDVTVAAVGPTIPTAAPLGGIIYTQYVNKIPFKPEMWPFHQKMPTPKNEFKKIFFGKYMIQKILKFDEKGCVFQGIYLKGFLRISKCVIKQGKPYMWYDDQKRDVRDRLLWQQSTLNDLCNILNVPKVIDLIHDDDHVYLVMEFVSGQQFEKIILELYYNRSYAQLKNIEKKKVTSYLIRIIDIIQTLHNKGYIHRDITPANFMLDKKDNIFLIDMELTYNKNIKYPKIPFAIGTVGFMSPQQFERQTPNEAEDIYAFGGMITYFLTGIAPYKFDFDNSQKLINALAEYIEDKNIINIISDCYRTKPEERPSLKELRNVLQRYEHSL
jgi:tRNA A-37 threonylcarbamoyl transferase component Bud32